MTTSLNFSPGAAFPALLFSVAVGDGLLAGFVGGQAFEALLPAAGGASDNCHRFGGGSPPGRAIPPAASSPGNRVDPALRPPVCGARSFAFVPPMVTFVSMGANTSLAEPVSCTERGERVQFTLEVHHAALVRPAVG